MQFVDFKEIVGPTYTLSSLSAECQRCVNLFPEVIESGKGQNTYYLKETPGLKNFFYFGAGITPLGFDAYVGYPIQCLNVTPNGRVFFICLSVLFEITFDGTTPTVTFRSYLLGAEAISYEGAYPGITAKAATAKWRMSSNTLVLCSVLDLESFNKSTAYIPFLSTPTANKGIAVLNLATNATANSSVQYAYPGYLGTKFIDFLDNFFLTQVTNVTGTTSIALDSFQISPFAWDGVAVWDAVNVFPMESSPDTLNSLVVNGRYIWLFGPASYEVWYDAGNSESLSLAFQRVSGAAYPIGCIAPETVKVLQSQVFWLGSSKDGYGIVYTSNGLQAEKISNTSVELLITSYVTISDAIAWSYQIPGHTVYVITFPTAKATLAYDMSTGLWHELSFRDSATGTVGRHRVNNQIFAFGKNLVGDYEKGIIYELDPDTYSDNIKAVSNPIIRYRRSPVLATQKRDVFHQKLELDVQGGVGDSAGSDPKVSIRWSDDNGNTWGNYHTTSIGKLGEYKKRVIFNRLGISRKRVYEIYYNEPTPFRLISAEIGIQVGVN